MWCGVPHIQQLSPQQTFLHPLPSKPTPSQQTPSLQPPLQPALQPPLQPPPPPLKSSSPGGVPGLEGEHPGTQSRLRLQTPLRQVLAQVRHPHPGNLPPLEGRCQTRDQPPFPVGATNRCIILLIPHDHKFYYTFFSLLSSAL